MLHTLRNITLLKYAPLQMWPRDFLLPLELSLITMNWNTLYLVYESLLFDLRIIRQRIRYTRKIDSKAFEPPPHALLNTQVRSSKCTTQ